MNKKNAAISQKSPAEQGESWSKPDLFPLKLSKEQW